MHRSSNWLGVGALAVWLIAATSWAGNRLEKADVGSIDLCGYVYGIRYGGATSKDCGDGGGVYYRAHGEGNTLELDVDWLNLDYLADVTIEQWDVNLLCTNYSIPNWRLQFGAHHISSDDVTIDGATVWQLGAHRYKWGAWELGVNAAWSSYDDYANGVDVLQVSPQLTYVLWSQVDRYVSLGLTCHWISLSEDVGFEDEAFASFEGNLRYQAGAWSIGLSGWGGKQVAALRSNGAFVFSPAELRTGGGGLDLSHTTDGGTHLGVRVGYEEFNLTTNEPASSTVVVLLIGCSF